MKTLELSVSDRQRIQLALASKGGGTMELIKALRVIDKLELEGIEKQPESDELKEYQLEDADCAYAVSCYKATEGWNRMKARAILETLNRLEKPDRSKQ